MTENRVPADRQRRSLSGRMTMETCTACLNTGRAVNTCLRCDGEGITFGSPNAKERNSRW